MLGRLAAVLSKAHTRRSVTVCRALQGSHHGLARYLTSVSADVTAQTAAEPGHEAVKAEALMPDTTTSHFRVRMMRALKNRDHVGVLSEYEAMVEAEVPPDLIALNCIIEAKGQSEGTTVAYDTLQVHIQGGKIPCDIRMRPLSRISLTWTRFCSQSTRRFSLTQARM